jgi:hypothetical protein
MESNINDFYQNSEENIGCALLLKDNENPDNQTGYKLCGDVTTKIPPSLKQLRELPNISNDFYNNDLIYVSLNKTKNENKCMTYIYLEKDTLNVRKNNPWTNLVQRENLSAQFIEDPECQSNNTINEAYDILDPTTEGAMIRATEAAEKKAAADAKAAADKAAEQKEQDDKKRKATEENSEDYEIKEAIRGLINTDKFKLKLSEDNLGTRCITLTGGDDVYEINKVDNDKKCDSIFSQNICISRNSSEFNAIIGKCTEDMANTETMFQENQQPGPAQFTNVKSERKSRKIEHFISNNNLKCKHRY